MQREIEALYANPPRAYTAAHLELFGHFKAALNRGVVRAAEPDPGSPTGWRVNSWVKQGILIGFRLGAVVDMSIDPVRQPFFDRATWPVKQITLADGIRILPGGSSIRDGSFVGRNVSCIPPMYINFGAWVGDGTLVDSHALIGSCAQIGTRCHISAGAQIGGVLEPVGALPVIIEDDVLVGGNCGVYEGTVVQQRAVLGSGTILTRSTPVYDIVRGAIYSATDDEPLIIPHDAVVVPGSRAVAHGRGKEWGLSLQTPVIVKYRDVATDARVALETLLR
jgi:2,3,4,5-tetrahydropyridine-2,6-dicarboxylate N-succinyltransferase